MDLIDKLTVAPSGQRYKFIHLVTPHAPLVTLADCSFAGASLEYSRDAFVQQSRCTLKDLVSLLKKLKISGVYDNSLLIIHGDHGGGVPFDMVGENGVKTNSTEALSHMWGNPLPLVLIKPRFESGKLKISNQPVQLLDLPTTVAHQLGLDGNFPGHSMFEKNGKDVIPRYYYQSNIHRNEAAAKGYFEDFSTYLISGSIYATSSWPSPPWNSKKKVQQTNNEWR